MKSFTVDSRLASIEATELVELALESIGTVVEPAKFNVVLRSFFTSYTISSKYLRLVFVGSSSSSDNISWKHHRQ